MVFGSGREHALTVANVQRGADSKSTSGLGASSTTQLRCPTLQALLVAMLLKKSCTTQ